MPFIPAAERRRIEIDKLPAVTPGQKCFKFYKPMVDKWKKDPRWTTAHKIYRRLVNLEDDTEDEDEMLAGQLAWQVFFSLHVMPYELKKREENGDI